MERGGAAAPHAGGMGRDRRYQHSRLYDRHGPDGHQEQMRLAGRHRDGRESGRLRRRAADSLCPPGHAHPARRGRGGEPQVQFDRRAGAAVAAAAPSRAHLHRTGLYGDERQQAEVGARPARFRARASHGLVHGRGRRGADAPPARSICATTASSGPSTTSCCPTASSSTSSARTTSH